MADEKCIVGLDIGTSVIRVAIGEVDEDGNLIISMVENVENRGGSNYVVKKIAQIFDTMVKEEKKK